MVIPEYIQEILEKLENAGFEAYIVGGCVRDFLRGVEPKDWDVTTSARPDDILEVFPEGKYENIFGTVIVPVKNEKEETEYVVEVTTYRSEQGYSDRRHPDQITFEDRLDRDLERRDFTVNAMAIGRAADKKPEAGSEEIEIDGEKYELVDLFGGRKDLDKKVVRAVGEPTDRFKEDALRMMRAVRFSCQLKFSIEPKTERAIVKLAGSIKFISNERLRDELVRILQSDRAYEGIMMLHDFKLLQYLIPELEKGIGVEQAKHHIHTVFKHSLLSLKYCPSKDWRVRFAALLHDIAKPQTKRIIDGGATFYNHDFIGARVTEKIMKR
ncbi:MAG: HD domain-containing protein, partial [Patescibacteria group bacterium]